LFLKTTFVQCNLRTSASGGVVTSARLY